MSAILGVTGAAVATNFFYSGSKVIAGVHAMTRDLIIPFAREYKRYVLSRGQSAERLVIPGSKTSDL
jgi:hypothetical protein